MGNASRLGVACYLHRGVNLGSGKFNHSVQRFLGGNPDVFIDYDFILSGLEDVGEPRKIIHLHPGAMRATYAGSAFAGSGRRYKIFIWCRLPHLMKDSVFSSHDKRIIFQFLY